MGKLLRLELRFSVQAQLHNGEPIEAMEYLKDRMEWELRAAMTEAVSSDVEWAKVRKKLAIHEIDLTGEVVQDG